MPAGVERLSRGLVEHRDTLFAYLLAIVRDWHEAEELFQEVCLVVLEKERAGAVIVDRFLPWSREIARRLVLRHFRTRVKRPRPLSPELLHAIEQAFASRDDAAERQTRAADLVAKLERSLAGLPRPLRQVIDWYYRDALPIAEIARRTGRSPGAVQVALSRARLHLLRRARRLNAEEKSIRYDA
jgi:RNA polymerase sigma-70 factor (ECF subfamily)